MSPRAMRWYKRHESRRHHRTSEEDDIKALSFAQKWYKPVYALRQRAHTAATIKGYNALSRQALTHDTVG